MRRWIPFTLALLTAAAFAADETREQRWADEILPGLVVGEAIWLASGEQRFLGLLASAAQPKAAVIVIHGMGVHPDWGLVGTLRGALADRGYTTLSIQMPVLAAEAKADDYAPTYPEAAERIAMAVQYLMRAKSGTRIALVSHSLGGRMANEYLKRQPQAPLFAWVAIGLSGSFEDLDSNTVSILDLYGAADLPTVLASAPARAEALARRAGSRQLRIAGADHFFAGREQELVDAVSAFLSGGP